MAFIDDDEVEGLDGDLRIVSHRHSGRAVPALMGWRGTAAGRRSHSELVPLFVTTDKILQILVGEWIGLEGEVPIGAEIVNP